MQETNNTLSKQMVDIRTHYTESRDFLYPRKLRQVKQLILLNNLQRGDENIASTLILTLFNRIMSNLYDDKMQVKFVPSEEIDQKKVNSINLLAQNDYREMDKQVIDYDWTWDALAFGKGFCETLRFDKKRKIMQPQVLNPLAFGYDPYFNDPQQWRYYWKWLIKSKWEIEKLIKKGLITGIKSADELPPGVDPDLWDFKIRRDQAKMANAVPASSYQGDVYQILEYFGYDEEGVKCVWWVDNSFNKVLFKEPLDLRDDEDKDSKWPIVVKEGFREPHSSISVSILDLLEDKHRAKSVLLNLAYIAAKDEANPTYLVNPDKVQDISAFFSRQINQHILTKDATDLTQVVMPLNTKAALSQSLMSFIQLLTQEANDPVGTGMAITGLKKGKATATETAIQQQLNDLAQSLQSKVLQFGEKDFWSHWYQRYLRYSKEGDEKMATIVGVKGVTFETIDLGDIRTKYPPKVLVFSAKEAEYKELVLRRDLMQLYPQFQETLGQEGMRNFNKHVFFPKFLQDPTLIDIIIPKSLDEIKAEDENEQLNLDELPNVSPEENHEQHIYIHMQAKNTWAKFIHKAWHEELLAKNKQDEKMKAEQSKMGEPPSAEASVGGGSTPPMGQKPKIKEKQKQPLEAVSSLKDQIQPKTVTK
jgi:hypothetical protein